MLFNSDVFLFGFLPPVFVVFWLLRTKQQRYVWLTGCSYVFYGWWNWHFCFLLFSSSIISYVVALLIDRSPTPRRRRLLMQVSITFDLIVLGIFKYFNFFISSVFALIPGHAAPELNIILPIGISFYTFHTISYIADVGSGRVRATRNLPEYLTYVSLFSQLVAGPIVRFKQIREDLEGIGGGCREDYIARGLGFFTIGLIKKVVVADQIAIYVNAQLSSVDSLSALGGWCAAIGYALQIYYDFSGYSDMAVGLGYLFGIRIPQNFNAPYKASSMGDFWHRWHISLSSWLRDYLYIPLGGSRHGARRTYINLFVTMFLGGLWHGASWTFIIWGSYHGVLLIVERILAAQLSRLPEAVNRVRTFLLVVVGWVFFRATDLQMTGQWLGAMVGLHAGRVQPPEPLILWIVGGVAVINLLPDTWGFAWGTRRRWSLLYACCFLVALIFMHQDTSPFLYYRF